MEDSSGKPLRIPPLNPMLSLSTFINRVGANFAARVEGTRRFAAAAFQPMSLPFASISQQQGTQPETSPNSAQIARSLAGTSVYTVSNMNNEFVLISDPDGVKSIGLLCFRKEDAEAFLAQARLRKGLKGGAKVVPISLDQVYMLKVEGIAFRFLPDPVQIRHALELRASDSFSGFDGVPVFQSDLLVVKKDDRRYCPIYFQKEDLERALLTGTRRRSISPQLVVGSLEDVLKKMEISEEDSGWRDLIFIPPGKSHSQHIQDISSD